jgi:hypothetical protein
MLTRGRRHRFHPKPAATLTTQRGGRLQIGTLAAFKSESWGRLQIGTVADIKSKKVAAFSWNLHP